MRIIKSDNDQPAMIASTQTNHPIADTKSAAKPAGTPVEQACDRLRLAGLRITQPRISILKALASRAKPASIEQIHEDLAHTSCDLVTVYRCLAAFQELGLVRRCYFENGTSLYQLSLESAPVYYVVTREGNVAEQIDPVLAAEISAVTAKIEARLKAQGYTAISHLVEFFADAPRIPPPAAQLRASASMPAAGLHL
jgi:Fur family ferric uptake transcriptional regulator